MDKSQSEQKMIASYPEHTSRIHQITNILIQNERSLQLIRNFFSTVVLSVPLEVIYARFYSETK